MPEETQTDFQKQSAVADTITQTNFEKWFEVFKKGWDVRVIENEHLMEVCFLEVLSVINKVKYVYGSRYKNPNLSSLKIQQSGTGKGVCDGFVQDILKHLGYKTAKINWFSDAHIVGTLKEDKKGNITLHKGALGKYDFLWIDEAKALIEGNNYTGGLSSTINGFLDNGEVYKGMANGEIKYHSNCILGAGSFFFDKLKLETLDTGLFQRALFTYKSYTHEDIMRISRKIDGLAEKDYLKDLKPVINELREMMNNLDFEKYKETYKKYSTYVIRMDKSTSIKFGKELEDFYEKNIVHKLSGNRLKCVLDTFYQRSKELGHRIMAINAVWNGYDRIDDRCIPFALDIIKKRLTYVLDFMSDVFEDTVFDKEEFNNEKYKRKNIDRTKNNIKAFIRKNPGITKTELKEHILKNKSKFKIGENKIRMVHLPAMLAEGELLEEVGLHNSRKLYAKEDINLMKLGKN